MKNFFAIAGFVIFFAVLLFVANKASSLPVPLGVYLFPITCLIAATFWKAEDKGDSYYHYAHKIYELLAKEKMSMDDLIDAVDVGYQPGDQTSKQVKKTVVRMIEEGNLTIMDRKVCLSPGRFMASTSPS